jgi:spermidine synthase/MFS family permease
VSEEGAHAAPMRRLLALSFLSGAALMACELAAPRLLAPHLGAGLWTWSTIFAVFLGGLAGGNALGGRLADRGGARTLRNMLLASALAVLLTRTLAIALEPGALADLPRGVRTPLVALALFGPAAFAIGTIGPALARAVLAASPGPGRALGLVGAAGAIGSVFGTFITGFLLVPHVATPTVYDVSAGVLLACVPMAHTVALAPARRAQTPGAGTLPPGWAALAGLAGGALLVVEVIAARVAANRLGTSVYTWTSVVGVVLVALAAGNAVGGRLADRRPPRPLLATLLLGASVAVAACLWTPALMTQIAGAAGPWILVTLGAVAVGFFAPAFAIGTLTPVIVRAALTDPATDGRTVGRLYAIATAGAVVGSLATGYVLIPLLQVPLAITLLALGLGVAAWRVGGRPQGPWIGTLAVVALLAGQPFQPVRALGLRLGVREDRPGVHVRDSRYFHIVVEPHEVRWVRLPEPMELRYLATDPLLAGQLSFARHPRRMFWRGAMTAAQRDRLEQSIQEIGNRQAARELHARTQRRMRILSLDRFGHGFVDLDDPLWLEYEYEILTGALIRALWPAGGARRCFFIGGGAYTFQRRLSALYPGRAQIVSAEIDPAVTETAVSELGLAITASHRILHDDARTVLRTFDVGGASFDFAFGDAFHDLAVPWHLTTVEFARAVKRRLAEDGVYLVNVIDMFASGRFLGAFVGTLESTFGHVRVLSMGPREDHTQETFLVVASDRALAWGALVDDEGLPLDVVEYDASDLEVVRARAGHIVLRDAHAPVESLLAPVVRLRRAGGR